jgi:alpha-glucosidase
LFRVVLAEAYANISMTMLYYGDEKGRVGAHFPFNFDFITRVWAGSTARDFAYAINHWLIYMPYGNVANWVVSIFYITLLSRVSWTK